MCTSLTDQLANDMVKMLEVFNASRKDRTQDTETLELVTGVSTVNN